MDESTEDVVRRGPSPRPGRPGNRKLEASVRPLSVVVANVLNKDPFELPVETMSGWSRQSARTVSIQRSAWAFARGARTGVRMVSMSSLPSTFVEGGGEPGVPVTYQEADGEIRLVDIEGEVASHLGHPGTVGIRRDPEAVQDPALDLNHEESVETLTEHGVDVEEVRASIVLAWERMNSVQLGPLRRGVGTEAEAAEDPADCGGSEWFTHDSRIAPTGILLNQPADQCHRPGTDGWTAGPVGAGPTAAHDLPLPLEDRGWFTRKTDYGRRGSGRAARASQEDVPLLVEVQRWPQRVQAAD